MNASDFEKANDNIFLISYSFVYYIRTNRIKKSFTFLALLQYFKIKDSILFLSYLKYSDMSDWHRYILNHTLLYEHSFLYRKISFKCKIFFFNSGFLQTYASIAKQSFLSIVYYLMANRMKASFDSIVLLKYFPNEIVPLSCNISSTLIHCTDVLNHTLVW